MDIQGIVDMLRRVHDAERWDLGASSTRDYRNDRWERLVGIVHHGHPVYNPTPDPRWHIKRADANRPPSDDVVVLMPSREFWDCIGGAGADGYTIRANYDGVLPADQIVYAPRVPDGSTGAPPPPSPMWTPLHSALVARLGAPASPEGDVAFVRRVAEQFAHSFPGEGWGMKRYDPTRPLSDNVVARQTSTSLAGFRIVPLSDMPAYYDLTGQAFEAVTPINHVGATVDPPPPVDPPVDPPPPPPVDATMAADIAAIKLTLDDVRIAVDGLGVLVQHLQTRRYAIDASARIVGPIRGTATPQE